MSPAVEPGFAPATSAGAELRPGAEVASPTAERWLASESAETVDEPRPSGEAASLAAERWPAPEAAVGAELRSGGEAASPADSRWPASEAAVGLG